jgi:hypothetical protein
MDNLGGTGVQIRHQDAWKQKLVPEKERRSVVSLIEGLLFLFKEN